MVNDPRTRLQSFLSELLARKGDARPFEPGEGLVSGGRLDSVDVLEIVTHLEAEHGVDFAVRSFDPEQLDSLDGILAWLQSGA